VLLWQVLRALESCPKSVFVCISEAGPLQACQHKTRLPNASSFSRRDLYGKARQSTSRLHLRLSLGVQRVLAGRALGKESGKTGLSLKSTANFFVTNRVASRSLSFTLCGAALKCAHIQWPEM